MSQHKVVIIQSSYVPWRGYFDLIHGADTFIFLEDVQYTLRDWRSRNRVRIRGGGSTWLTVPVSGGRDQQLTEVCIDQGRGWAKKHLGTLQANYAKSPYFRDYFPRLQEILGSTPERLSALNMTLTKQICAWLGITTTLRVSTEFETHGVRDANLIELTLAVGGDHYTSGPAGKAYMDPQTYADAGIELHYKDYAGYPTYEQVGAEWEPMVSVLDLLFMKGPDAPWYIWGWRDGPLPATAT